MAFDFSQGRPLTEKETKEFEPKSFLQKAGEFIFPTTTGLITGEKQLTPRTGVGAALEVAATAYPPTALRRLGIGLGAKIAPRLFKTGVEIAKKAPEVLTTGIGGRLFRGIQGQAKETAKIGGITGTMFGAGRALGEEELPLTEVPKEAITTGVIGAVGAGVLTPITSLGIIGGRGLVRAVSNNIKKVFNQLRPQTKEIAINNLTQGYYTSFVQNSPSILNSLEKEVLKSRRQNGPDTEIGLLKELAEEGYIPKIEDEIARMRPVIDELSDNAMKLVDTLDNFLKPIKKITPLTNLKSRAIALLKERLDIDPIKSGKEIETIFTSLKQKFGSKITALNINQIRKEMNKRTKAFRGEKFVQDTADSIADASREILDELVPTGQVRKINNGISKLIRMQRVANILDNKKVRVEFWGEAMGRFAGTIGAGMLGGQILGPGGLVLAGLYATMGSKIVANFFRSVRFNPQLRNIIQQGLTHDKRIFDQLIKEATPKDAVLLKEIIEETPKRIFKTR